jgi:hypothetical protein
MKILPLLVCVAFLSTHQNLCARGGGGGGGGGGGFHGGGGGEFREEGMEDQQRPVENFDNNVQVDRTGQDNFRVDDSNGSADVRVNRDGDDTANVNVRTADGRDYDATVAGPEGYRSGYIWRDNGYVAVDCDPFVPYAAPFGLWAGWTIVTQPLYLQYPVYNSYPVQTAVQLALQKLGLYSGAIDGNAASCAGAIEQYQMQNSMPVTGQISPELLTALGIQASQAGL